MEINSKLYKIAHKLITPLGLNRFKGMRVIRKIAVGINNKNPISINGEYQLYTDDYNSLDLLTERKFEDKEFEVFKNSITSDMIGLDVGANIGYYSVLFAKHSKQVYCFEIQKANYELLKKNIALNKLEDKATIIQKAVSDSSQKKVEIYTGDMNNFANLSKERLHQHSLFSKNYKVEEVETIRIDDFFKDKQAPDYAKIDVDGHELEVVRGASILSKMKFFMIEINLEGDKKEQLINMIKKMGFKMKLINGINYWCYR